MALKIRSKKVLINRGTKSFANESACGQSMETSVLGEPRLSFISHDRELLQVTSEHEGRLYSFVAKMKVGFSISGDGYTNLSQVFERHFFDQVEISVVTMIQS